MTELKKLCTELDDTLIDFFGVQQEILLCQHEIGLCLKDGYFLMAKARYNMGAKSVSSLQYNENDLVEADIKVNATESEGSFTLAKDVEDVQKAQDKTEGLRQRSVQHVQDSVENMKITDDSKSEKEVTKVKKNPINWFGILVPQTLRQSQARFKRAAELTCDLATLKVKYSNLQNLYRDLLQQKQNLLNESLDTDIVD